MQLMDFLWNSLFRDEKRMRIQHCFKTTSCILLLPLLQKYSSLQRMWFLYHILYLCNHSSELKTCVKIWNQKCLFKNLLISKCWIPWKDFGFYLWGLFLVVQENKMCSCKTIYFASHATFFNPQPQINISK